VAPGRVPAADRSPLAFDARRRVGQCAVVTTARLSSLRQGLLAAGGILAVHLGRGGAGARPPQRLLALVPSPPAARAWTDSPPANLALVVATAPLAEDVPEAVRRARADGALWVRALPGDTLGLRYWDAEHRVLHEATVPRPEGSSPAVAEALWLRFQFLFDRPPAAGRPWPPPAPTVPPLAPELAAVFAAPPADPWPPLPDFTVPALPPPTRPPDPRGEVELTIAALPGAERAPIGVAATPDQLDPATGPDAAGRDRGAPGHVQPRAGFEFEVNVPEPISLGAAFRLALPLGAGEPAAASAPGTALIGVVGASLWHSALAGDPALTLPGVAVSPRIEVGVGAAWGDDALRLQVSATAGLGGLVTVEGEADEAWQGALRLGTAIGWVHGRLMPFAGFEAALSPWVLVARRDDERIVLAERFRLGVLLGVGYAFGP
jgi:hypothetical protein